MLTWTRLESYGIIYIGQVLQMNYANDSVTAQPFSDLNFMKKLISARQLTAFPGQSASFENQNQKPNPIPVRGCFCPVMCEKGSRRSLGIREHLSVIHYLTDSLVEMTSDTSVCVLSPDHREESENCGLLLQGYTEPFNRMKVFSNMRPFADSAVYLWQNCSKDLTGATYCCNSQSGSGGCFGTTMSVQAPLWFWLVQLLYSLLISTKHFSVGFLG